MTKIKEAVHFEDGKLIVQETHDFTPVLERNKALRSAGVHGSESRLVGNIPMKVWHEWAKKWGVKPSDTQAMKEVVKRELMDSDNSQLRVWEGSY